MQRTKSKILSILLSLVMLLSLLPTTALAAGNLDPTAVSVNGGISFSSSNLYYTNGASACSNNSTGWNAAYDPTTGTLTLDGYSGGSIRTGGTDADITVVLKGTNTINDGSLMNDMGGDITITSDCGGTLSITNTLSNSNPAIGIEAGLSGSYQTGNVTIKGSAAVTINMTHNGESGSDKAHGIFAKENITISENASVDIICATPNNTARWGDNCNGLYAKNNVTIDTNGTIKIDVRNAGGDGAYSIGIYPMGGAILTKVGKMEVQGKMDGSSGRAVYGSASFDPAEYDTNETTATNAGTTYYIATYTPKGTATITSVSATVSQPVKGHPLDTTVNVGTATAYTAMVMWKDVEENMTATGDAKPGKIYTALITLTAKEGEAFSSSLHNTTTPGGYTIEWLNSTELLLTKEFERTNLKEATGIIIDNTTLTVAVPTAEPNMEQKAELPLTAKVIYDDGTDETVGAFWSIVDPKPEGVDIDKTTGKLTVTNKAAGGTVKVKAALNGMTDEKTVTIKKDGPVATAIVLTAPTPATVAVPKNNTPNEIALPTAAVYDQYGMPMTGTSTITYESVDTTPTGVTLVPGSGKIKVERTAQAGEVKIVGKLTTAAGTVTSDPVTYNITRETSQVTSVRVDAPEYIMYVPKVTKPGTTSQTDQQFNAAKVLDQYGQEMTGQTVTWKVADDAGNLVTGVSIDATGKLTVTNEASAITVYVTATCSGIVSNRSKVTINKEPAKATLVEICNQVGEAPETRLLIPAATFTNSEAYMAKVYDQYGAYMPGEMVDWELVPATVASVELDTTTSTGNAILKVDSTATSGTTFKLVATSSTVTTVKGELDITVQKKNDVNGKINFNDGSLTYTGAGQKYEKAALDSSVTAGEGGKWTYTYAVSSGGTLDAAGLPKTVGTYTVTAKYEDSLNIGSKSVTLTITPKKVDIPAADTTVYTYDGNAKTYGIADTADYTVTGNTKTNANEAGHIVTVTLKDITNTTWSDGTTGVKIYHFYIYKATPTGAPAYTKITTSGKTLNDAALTTTGGTFSVSGTVKWVDDTTGADLPDTTAVEANKLYKWVFTPSDSTNYEPINGTIKLWNKSTSSGGYYYAPTAAVVPDMPMLYRGCTGDAVKTLQDKLNALGYNSGNVDGIFGAKTYAAVTAFQKANSLGVDGIVGKLTWGKLYGVSPAMPVETTTVVGRPMVSYGSRGDAVRKLQELLNALGYDCGSVDGIFGSKTKAAVLAFQKANGLGVDGIVGPLTWAKLG